MEADELDDPRDRRASARAKRRKESLYEHDPEKDAAELERQQAVSSTRISNYRWKFGEDPHDDDATPESGYEYTKVEVAEDHTKTEKERFGLIGGGQPSGVQCFECRHTDYLIIDQRTAQEVIESRPDVDWAQKMNRPLDFWRSQAELMLFCPSCKGVTQLLEGIYLMLKAQTERAREGAR